MDDSFKIPEILPAKSRKSEPVTELKTDDDLSSTGEKSKATPTLPSTPSKSKEQILAEKQAKYNEILASIKYHPPADVGSQFADSKYSFEVLKNGTIVDKVKFSKLDNKGFYVIGRVPACDVVAEHPTVSRTHAVFQFISCPEPKDKKKVPSKVGNGEEGIPDRTGLYVFDLNSTHGTFINKNQIFPHRFYRLHVGHVLKFGNSTRLYVLLGPEEDEEEESEKSVTELQNEKLAKELERKKLEEQGILIKSSTGEDEGCGWGMGDDAEEETDARENPFAMNFEESESFDNPKKTLRGWFEREGYDLVYDCREKAPGQFICRINLPVDGPSGQPVFAEVDIKGKKKEAAHHCALQACQILDKYGVLRVANHESKSKRKKMDWEEKDYYSSDEDTFLDRTGSVEKKREKRMKIAGKLEETVETFDSLFTKSKNLQNEIDILNSQITEAQNAAKADEEVDLDDYVQLLKTGVTDVKKLKAKLREANEELKKVNKLLEFAKPASLPSHLVAEDKKPVISPKAEKISEEVAAPVSFNKPQIKFNLNKTSEVSESSKSKITETPTSSNDAVGNKEISKHLQPAKLLFGPRNPTKPAQNSSKTSPIKKPKVPAAEDSDEEDQPKGSKDNIQSEEESSDEDIDPSVQKKKRGRQRQKVVKKEVKYDYDKSDPKYSTWVPPTDQKGDGKTSLNEKLGY